MGNCWGANQVNNQSTSTTKTSSSTELSQNANFRGKSSKDRYEKKNGEWGCRSGEGKTQIPNLKIFTLAELRMVTKNFRPDQVLGEGGFGRVYRGWVEETTCAPSKTGVGIPVAVKRSHSDQAHRFLEWKSEVKFLGKLSHPNLVKLLGFCLEQKEFLLVYEYMQKGSLDNHLFRKNVDLLSWSRRFDIAIGAARGLAFLHAEEKQVIYRDFKPSNILLDGNYNAKLSDFGLAKLGPVDGDTHVSTRPKGTYGYAAPEYVASGHLYVNSDVYGFGVVLLEIITGLRAIDTNRAKGEHYLVEWAKPSLNSKRKLKKIMDPRLEERYPMEGAIETAQLILRCLEEDPKKRPCMDQVLGILETKCKKVDSISRSSLRI